MPQILSLQVAVSPGELIDKISILEIKDERIADDAKRQNVRRELETLRQSREESVPPSTELTELAESLKSVNESLWDIENRIRDCERNGDFGSRFIALARSVYRTNDIRAELKRSINALLGSAFVEEKSYADYDG